MIRHTVASAVLVSALGLSAPSRAQLVETSIQPSTDANANWSATAGQTAGAGNAVLQFEAGWPGIGFTYLKGLDERSDVGFHIGFNYGIEGTTTTVADDGHRYSVVFFPSANIPSGARLTDNPDYPRAVADFEHSFSTWKALPCDIFLGSHAEFFDLASKRKRLAAGERPNPFIDPEGYRHTVAEAEEIFRKTLASER